MHLLIALYLLLANGDDNKVFPLPAIDFGPRHYTCVYTQSAPTIDGKLDDKVWSKTRFSELFVDIEGTTKPAPLYDTRMAMVFDDTYLYIAARLDEPHVWAKLKERDSIIFYDPDFEVFIDPDGDTHEYYELEVNALGTVWDLFLSKPYRDDGAALHDWNFKGLKLATHVMGTLNDPSDQDQGWTVEMAIPWEDLKVCAHREVPPQNGDRWRMNFSRVEWRIDTSDGSYRKLKDPETGKPFPEHNWVWSPQGLIQMHYPELWGFVTFVRQDSSAPDGWRPEEQARYRLRTLYYAQKSHHQKHGTFAAKIELLNPTEQGPDGYHWPPELFTTPSSFELMMTAKDGKHRLHLSGDGRIWRKDN